MVHIGIIVVLVGSLFLVGCSDKSVESEAPNPDLSIEEDVVVFEDFLGELRETPDYFGYAATDTPDEVFRFEYRFQSSELGFSIKANQLNERVIADITFDDQSNYPIELYVNEYRILVADFIWATKTIAASGDAKPNELDSIVVQSVAKTYRLEQMEISLSSKLIEWVANNLRNDEQRIHFRSQVEVLK